jgi:hypothetical protein
LALVYPFHFNEEFNRFFQKKKKIDETFKKRGKTNKTQRIRNLDGSRIGRVEESTQLYREIFDVNFKNAEKKFTYYSYY